MAGPKQPVHAHTGTEDVEQAQRPKNVKIQKKRRAEKQVEWAKSRPIFKDLYADLDMTLKDVMQKMNQDHGFVAT